MFDNLYMGELHSDHLVYCCAYEEGCFAWRDIYYDLSKKGFYIYSFEVCGSDLSDEKVTKIVLISEEEALRLMDEPHKEFLKKCIERYPGV